MPAPSHVPQAPPRWTGYKLLYIDDSAVNVMLMQVLVAELKGLEMVSASGPKRQAWNWRAMDSPTWCCWTSTCPA